MGEGQEEATHENELAHSALRWGILTWVSNGAGCLIGMVPIALPIGILLTIVTLGTGVWAMVQGVRGKRYALAHEEAGLIDARVGFWLGASHMAIVLVVSAVAGGLLASGTLQG